MQMSTIVWVHLGCATCCNVRGAIVQIETMEWLREPASRANVSRVVPTTMHRVEK